MIFNSQIYTNYLCKSVKSVFNILFTLFLQNLHTPPLFWFRGVCQLLQYQKSLRLYWNNFEYFGIAAGNSVLLSPQLSLPILAKTIAQKT